MPHQPTLHEAHIAVAAPTQVVSGRRGEIDAATPATGIYHGEIRAVRTLELNLSARVDFIGSLNVNPQRRSFHSIVREIGESTADPALLQTRARQVEPGRVTETFTLHNAGSVPLVLSARLGVATDFATLADVKSERSVADVPSVSDPTGTTWTGSRLAVRASSSLALNSPVSLTVAPGATFTIDVQIDIDDREPPLFVAVRRPEQWLPAPDVPGLADTVAATMEQCVADLRGLLLADAASPEDVFFAAGAPWYLTLFGRDALWAARFVLPLTHTIALGTLRSLARRQAREIDPTTEATPGKIPHVVREKERVLSGGIVLPALYYGSVDATPLWVSVLHDAWRYGAADHAIQRLLPTLQRCLYWMRDAQGPDGFIRYSDSTGHGLANHGWKDSIDSIRDRDGRLAVGPLALCEVQAYAHAAALHGAAVLRHFGEGDPGYWEQWAQALNQRFREAFWINSSPYGPHPAVALENDGRPVLALTSNIGHLPGTGLCTSGEIDRIAALLMDPVLNTGYGLRTLASDTVGYNPVGYHTGSVWAHDTLIAAAGLAAEGRSDEAVNLASGILRAARAFDHRLPELHAGYADRHGGPLPYAAACRPQAWSSAAAIAAIGIVSGVWPPRVTSHLDCWR